MSTDIYEELSDGGCFSHCSWCDRLIPKGEIYSEVYGERIELWLCERCAPTEQEAENICFVEESLLDL